VNNTKAVTLLLQSLFEKYEISCEELAAKLNTPGARKWLWDYILINGDDKAYEVIQRIYDMALSIKKEAEVAGLPFHYLETRGYPEPLYHQTKQGFFLFIYKTPQFLATPFGKITIYNRGSSSDNADFSVAELFIRRLDAIFESFAYGGIVENFYEITAS